MPRDCVVWIDDDYWRSEQYDLIGQNYELVWKRNASDFRAWVESSDLTNVACMIVDVMLVQGDDCKFGDVETNEGLDTGLVVIRMLSDLGFDMKRVKVISKTTDELHKKKIEKVAKEFGCDVYWKGIHMRGINFLKWFSSLKLT